MSFATFDDEGTYIQSGLVTAKCLHSIQLQRNLLYLNISLRPSLIYYQSSIYPGLLVTKFITYILLDFHLGFMLDLLSLSFQSCSYGEEGIIIISFIWKTNINSNK